MVDDLVYAILTVMVEPIDLVAEFDAQVLNGQPAGD